MATGTAEMRRESLRHIGYPHNFLSGAIGYVKLLLVGSDPAPHERRSDRSGSQQRLTCDRSDRSESFVGPTLGRSTRSRGVDRARVERLHTLRDSPHYFHCFQKESL